MTDFLGAHWKTVIQILIAVVMLYYAYRFLSNTSGARMLVAFLVLLGMMIVSQLVGLELIQWLVTFLMIALVVVFQPELRRALVDVGSHGLFSLTREKQEFAEILSESVRQLSAKRYGALFAIQRGMKLDQYLETGVTINSQFQPELIMTIFHPKTALHDGGMILRNGRIEGAGCVFPVSQKEMSDRSIGLRHRAAMGISDETDAIAVVVSEETGHISLCHAGVLERDFEPDALLARLKKLLEIKEGDKEEEEEVEEEEEESEQEEPEALDEEEEEEEDEEDERLEQKTG